MGSGENIIKSWISANQFLTTPRNGPSSIHSSAWNGNIETLKLAIVTGDEINLMDGGGWTPLHLAVWNMHHMTVLILLKEFAADANTPNNNGWTATHLAAWNDDLLSLKWLLNAGADLTKCDIDGRSPIHWAAENESLLVMDVLLNAGCDPHKPDKHGRSALDLAEKTWGRAKFGILKFVTQRLKRARKRSRD